MIFLFKFCFGNYPYNHEHVTNNDFINGLTPQYNFGGCNAKIYKNFGLIDYGYQC